MKKPAARLGDMTTHGGTISMGLPTVIIGGFPAARVTDLHICPMMTANAPHLGGPIQTGSTGVKIGGQKAARVGDVATCSGPPDTIASGCQTVLIGGGSMGVGGGSEGAEVTTAGARAGAQIAEEEEPEPVYPYVLLSPDASGYQDGDCFILETADGSYSETLTYADARQLGHAAVLHFPDPPRGARYTLRVAQAPRPGRNAAYERTSYTLFQDEPLMRYEPTNAPSDESGLRS